MLQVIRHPDFGEVYMDENGNLWDYDKYSLREAEEMSDTLVMAFDNYNCRNLINSSGNRECWDLDSCDDCEYCSNCVACDSCIDCHDSWYLNTQVGTNGAR